MLLHCVSGSRMVHQHLPLKPFPSPWDSNPHGWDLNPLAQAHLSWAPLPVTAPSARHADPLPILSQVQVGDGPLYPERPGICIVAQAHTCLCILTHTEAYQTQTHVFTLTRTLGLSPAHQSRDFPWKSRLRSQAALLDSEVPSFPPLL